MGVIESLIVKFPINKIVVFAWFLNLFESKFDSVEGTVRVLKFFTLCWTQILGFVSIFIDDCAKQILVPKAGALNAPL